MANIYCARNPLSEISNYGREAVFFAIILLVMFITASYEIDPQTKKYQPVFWGAISGDEPHYMLTITSLLRDGDLDVRNNYDNIRSGGLDAGRRFKGQRLDHHTFIIDRRSGERWLWQSLFDYAKRIDCPKEASDEKCFQKKVHTDIDFDNAEEINAHPVVFSALLAAPLAILSLEEAQIEPYCCGLLILCSWLTLILLYVVGRRIGLNRAQSMMVIAVLCFASPWLAYSRSLFTENLCSLLLVAGLLSLLDKRIMLCGTLVSVAMAIKPLYVIIGFGWIACLFLQHRAKEALALTVTMGALGIGICLFNYQLVGTIALSGAQPWEFSGALRELHIEFTDSNNGLFLFAPWTAFVIFWLIKSAFNGASEVRLDFDILIALPSLFYYVVIAAHSGLSGYCYGPRYWVPLLPWFSLVFIGNTSRMQSGAMKLIPSISVLAGILIIIPGLFYYRFIWSMPNVAALHYMLSYLGLQ